MNIKEELKKLKEKENQERIKNGEYLTNGIWYKSKEEYDKIIRSEFAKIDKNSQHYKEQVECKRSFYGIRERDLYKYTS